MENNKIVESLKFLLSSVKKLSDSFIATDKRLTNGFEKLSAEVSDLQERIGWLEKQLEDFGDGTPASASRPMNPALPVQPSSEERVVQAINLSRDGILDVYASSPSLLEPFCRPCSVSARTLGGEIEEVELELFAQGTTWALQTLEGAWLLIPRPGTLERKTQLGSLQRLYAVEGVTQLPALLHLIEPAVAAVVVHGRRWQLSRKGLLHVHPDPLRVSTALRLADLDRRLAKLEQASG